MLLGEEIKRARVEMGISYNKLQKEYYSRYKKSLNLANWRKFEDGTTGVTTETLIRCLDIIGYEIKLEEKRHS